MNDPDSAGEPAEPFIFAGGGDGVPTVGFCSALLGGGVLLILIANNVGWEGWRPTENGPFAQGMLFFGIALACVGGWLFNLRARILALASRQQASERLGVAAEELPEFAAQHGVKPRCLVNGQPYYDLSDFTAASRRDAGSLLRASSAFCPDPQTLVRPAANADSTPADQLLHIPMSTAPSACNSVPAEMEKPTAFVPAVVSEPQAEQICQQNT